MPPKAAAAAAAAGTKDIRAFFSGSQTKVKRKADVIEISDGDGKQKTASQVMGSSASPKQKKPPGPSTKKGDNEEGHKAGPRPSPKRRHVIVDDDDSEGTGFLGFKKDTSTSNKKSPGKPEKEALKEDKPKSASSTGEKRKKLARHVLVSSDSESEPPKKKAATGTPTKKMDSEEEDHKAGPRPSPKRRHVIVDDDDSEGTGFLGFKKDTSTSNKKPPGKPAKKASKEDKPTPTPSTGEKRKKLARRVLVSSDSESEVEPPKKKKAAVGPSTSSVPKKRGGEEDKPKPRAKPRPSTAKGRDFIVDDDESEEEEEVKPKKPAPKKDKSTLDKKPAGKKEPKPAKKESISIEEDKPKAKPNFAAIAAKRAAGPSLPGSKAIPDGEPNCLAGLTFVFTGELTAFSRDEATDLAKRYGARVTGQPSGKTSYVVVGADAGPSKLAAIKKHGLNMLDEDGFLNIIGTRKGFIDDKTREKMAKEEAKIREAAKEMEKQEKKAKAATGISPSSQLWTSKYAPHTLKEICGNKGQVEKLQQWLHDWPASFQAGFKKPGKNGTNTFRAVMITGSPGIGKTTSAHLCAELEGYTPIELNASDARSKKLVENSTNIMNASLDGWISGGKTTLATGVSISDRSVLIMDEVDGMSAGDRGGVGALNVLIKKTRVPIICIANDRQAQKLKPLMHTTFNLPFRKPDANSIRSRIMSICFREGLKIPGNVIDQLIQGAQSDIRQVINMLSTWKLSNEAMDFDQGKALAKTNEKYMLMTPWGIMNKILGPYAFSPTARETLNDKMDLYFQDHAFVPMFMQENYVKIDPVRAKNLDGPEQAMKKIELLEKAASSVSDGDLVDAMIHSSEQHWSLMPLHAVTSTVRPAYYMYGTSSFVGANSISFPMWFGQNSKQGKLQRQLTDIQTRMRLRVSGDKAEIRTSYIPALHLPLVQPLVNEGASATGDVIECMDEYYLSKEDWDTIVELGVGDSKDDKVLKGISTATKTAFTRKYNSTDHPVAFHKSADLGRMPKKLAGMEVPDLEEAFDLDEPEEEEKEEKKPKDPTGVANDKLLKVHNDKGKGKALKAGGTSRK